MNEVPPSIEPRDYYTVLIHFYRGELGRIMIWRQRLDVTTNWAIVTSTGIITFGLSSPRNTHMVFAIANLLCLLLLFIEGRRYRYYDAFRARVRMLEAHLIMPVLMKDSNLLQGDWKKIMSEDLITPTFKLSRLDAISRRFMRNYFWIFGVILTAWLLKLWLHYPESRNHVFFLKTLISNDPLPTAFFLIALLIFYGYLFFLLIWGLKIRTISGEFQPGAMRRDKWI